MLFRLICQVLRLLGLFFCVLDRLAGLVLSEAGSSAVLLRGVIGSFLLLLVEKRAHPSQRIARDDDASRDDGLGASNVAVTAAFLVLARVGVQNVILAVSDETKGEVCVVQHGTLDLFGVLLDNGKGVIDSSENVGANGIGFGDDGSDVAIGTLGIGNEGRN